MILTTCRPHNQLGVFFENNVLVETAIKYGCKICVFNKEHELPIEIFDYDCVTVVSNYSSNRPSLNEMMVKVDDDFVIYANSDIEFDFDLALELLDFFKKTEFGLASARRRDYQWDKRHYKIQSFETLDIFFLNLSILRGLTMDELVPGTIKFDNLLIDTFLKSMVGVLDLSKVLRVYHRNHEKFKINGYLNLILKDSDLDSFQLSRQYFEGNLLYGSLAYADACLKNRKSFKLVALSSINKKVRYYRGRVKTITLNIMERLLSKLIRRIIELKEVSEQNYYYLLFIYIPRRNLRKQK